MCGLVGIAGKIIGLQQKKAFTHLLYIDAVRGWDSTGVAAVYKGNQKTTRLMKRAVTAEDFINTKSYGKLMSHIDTKALIGHNRAATKGTVVDRNAHPFTHGHISMCHNGTLDHWDALPRHSKTDKFAVDSEAIAHALSQTDDHVSVLEKLQGAYALTWYNQKDDTFNMARNSKRPLFFAIKNNGADIMWASEEGMLNWTIHKYFREDEYTIYELEPGYLSSFNLGNIESMNEYEYQEFTPKQYTSTGYTYYGYTSARTEVDQILAKHGLTKGEFIEIIPAEFIPPTATFKSAYGSVRGYTVAEALPIEMRYISEGEWDAMKDTTLKGEISYAVTSTNDPEGDFPTIIIRSADYTLMEPENNDRICAETPQEDESNAKEEKESIEMELAEEDSRGNIIPFVPEHAHLLPGPGGVFIPRKEWEDKTKHGCGYCTADITPDDVGDIMWIDHQTPVHSMCYAAYNYEGERYDY